MGGGSTEDEMVGWHHQLNGHEFQQTLGDNKGQGSLAVMQSTGSKKKKKKTRLSDGTQQNQIQYFLLSNVLDCGGGGGTGYIYKSFSRVKGVKATTREPHIKHGYYSLQESKSSLRGFVLSHFSHV